MEVVVIHLESWGRGGEPAALARERLAAAPSAVVMAVGAGPLPRDLPPGHAERRIVHVDAPLYTLAGRRFPDVRRSGDSPQLAWSLAVMQALSGLHADHALQRVELPTLGALAYASLQERATTAEFPDTRWVLRFDGLSAIEAARRGHNVEMRDLMVMDMERMCLEQCDQVIVDSPAVADALQAFLADPLNAPPLQAASVLPLEPLSGAAPDARAIACVASEAPALRQCLRAMAGYLQTLSAGPPDVCVVCAPGLLDEVLDVVPPSLRKHFVPAGAGVLSGPPMRIVMPDRWSAGAAFARELLAEGHVLIVESANVAFDTGRGWHQGRTLLRFDGGAAGLAEVLRASEAWRPECRIKVAASPEPAPHAAGRPRVAMVTIVVPCYNMGRWLPHTLRSIQRFTWPDMEVIVVDDGSSDPETQRLIEQLQSTPPAGLRVIRLAFNQGLSAARNVGVAAARGEFTLCLDADDLVSPEFVNLAARALQRFPKHDFVVPRCAYFVNDNGATDVAGLKLGQPLPLVGSAFDSGVFGNRFSTATCLARTSVLRALRYDEHLRSYEDWQLYRRALQQGSRFLITNDIHFFYRQRADSMIHDPAMRARHSRLYAEMATGPALAGRPLTASTTVLGTLAAPPRSDGSSSGLLLSGVAEALDEMHALRRSRIVGLAYRLSAMLRRLRRRI